MFRYFLQLVGAAGVFALVLFTLSPIAESPRLRIDRGMPVEFSPQSSSSPTLSPLDALNPAAVVTSTKPTKPKTTEDSIVPIIESSNSQTEASTNERSVARVENAYPTGPKALESVNTETRTALVNILCETTSGSFNPISGSGTIIDPRGVILTNAHVAQYVLLSTRPELRLSCTIRTGSPARPSYKASILFMPGSWVDKHANDIRASKPMGTGEHDYALLLITQTTDGSPLPAQFPFIPYDARETIGFTGDSVVVAAYPAEFTGGITTQMNLYASSAITQIRELLTFTDRPVDLISVGGVILAQSGSSGGAVVNAWGRLIAVVTTTSDGATTAERDLRAITLSYVDRALYQDSGVGLSTILSSDLKARNVLFMDSKAPGLAQKIIDQLR